MPPSRRWSSHRTRALAVAACVLASWTCDQQAAGPGRRAVLAVEALLPATDLAAFNLTIDNARLIVVSTTGDTVFDKTFSFPANQSSLPVSADVPLDASPAAFHVTIQLLSGTTLLFEGTQDVTLTGETATPVQVPVTYSGPGQNVASLTIDPADSSLSFGASLTFRPTARDAQGNPVTSFYVSWTTSDTVAAPIDATGTLVAPAARQTVTVTAHTPNNVSASTPITFAPVATGIGVVSGCGQTGAPGAQLPQPIVARVVAADGLGVKDVAVTFTPPSGGSVSPAQALTDASGQAQTTATLGATPGPASFTLSAGGLTPATCVQTVLSQATQLAFTTQPPASSVAGALFSVAVTARDAVGNPVTGFTGNVTLALGTNPGGASFTPVTVAAVAGVATFSVSIPKAGVGYTLVASASGLTSATSGQFDIVPAAPAQLVFSVQPTSVQLGNPITPAVAVTSQDAFGNSTPSFTGTVSMAIGTNPGGATLTGGGGVAAVAGTATFSSLSLDKVGTGYTLTASASGLTGATSTAFTVTAVSGLHLVFTQQPGNVTAGSVITPGAQVTAQDGQNNTVTSFTAPVTLAFGTCPTGAVLSGTPTVNAVAGVATFNDLSIDKAGGCTLVASSPTLQNVASNSFTILPGSPAQLAFSVQPPASVGVGSVLSPAVQVQVQDALGNLVGTAGNSITVAFGNNPTGATLGGTPTKSATSGVAVFSDLSVNVAGSGYTLVASAGTLTAATSTPFDVTAGAVARLAVAVTPTSVAAGTPATVTVMAQDAGGNTVTGYTGTVHFTSSDQGATLPANYAFVPGDNGSHTFASGVTLRSVGTQTVTATDAGNGSITGSQSVTVTPGPPFQLAFSAQPSAAVVGAPIAPVVVAVEDQFGNLANTATNPVTMALGPGSPSGATLGGTKTVAAVNGLAAFTNLTLDIAGTGFTLAASASGLAGATTAPFNVTSLTGGVAWNNPSGGNWSVAANWTPARVPGKSDSVFITLPGTYTVTLDVSDTVAFLTAGGSSGTQTLAVNGRTLGIDSAASLLANAAVNLTTATINGGAGGANVANSGTITVSPGGSTINGTVVINSGGQLVQNGNNGFADLSVSGTVTNAGTIELMGTSWGGRLTVSGGALQNQVGGTLQVVAGTGNTLTAALNNQGTVQVDGPLTINGASATHQNSGAITLGAGNLTLTQSGTTPSFTTTGSVVIGASRILQVNGGTFTYANASPGGLAGLGTVSLSGVTLGLNPDFTVDTLALTMTNSTVNGPGTLHVAATRTLTLTQSTLNAALDNAGTVLGTPGANTLNGVVTNQSGALLELNGNNGFADMTVANGFTNDGTIELTGTSWGGRLTVTNSILVNSATGTLQVMAGTGNTLTGALNNQGTVQVDGPLTINKASATHQNSGTITLGAGNLTLTQSGTTPSFTTTGTVVVGTGRTWAVSGGALNYSGGAIGGDGAMTLSGVTLGLSVTLSHDTLPVSLSVSLTNSTVNGPGTLPVAATSTLTMTGTTVNAPLVNFGTLQSTPGTNVLNGAVTNAPGALLRLNGNNGFADMTVASGFTNAGTIELTGTSWAGRLTVGSPTTPATLTNAVGASLLTTGGSGNVLAGALDNQGTVQVGGPLTLNAPSAGHGNSGLIKLAGGDLTVALSGTRPGFSNTGTIDVGTNKMVVSGAGSFINQSTGTLMGSGTFDVSSPNLSFLSNGITTVGGAPGVGLLTFVGTYIMGPTGSINVEIGGTPNPGVTFDQLHADSVVFQSGGTLNAADLGGTAGNNYPVLTSAKAINGGLQVFNIPSNCTPVVSSTQYVLQCR